MNALAAGTELLECWCIWLNLQEMTVRESERSFIGFSSMQTLDVFG